MNDELPQGGTSSEAEADNRLPVTMFLLGAGFIGGLLCGLVMLASRSTPDEAPAAASKFSTPERQQYAAQKTAAQQTTTAAAAPALDDVADDTARERERLQTELETLKLRQEVAELQLQLQRLNTSPVSTDPRANNESVSTARAASDSTESTAASTGETTLDFWNRMNDIIDREAAMRSTPQGGISASNAADFLDARVESAEYAVDALRNLSTKGVDNRAVEVSQALTAWYEQGRDVAQAGRDLLGQSPDVRQGAAGKRYQADERGWSQAVNNVNALGERMRQELSQAYGIKFPALK